MAEIYFDYAATHPTDVALAMKCFEFGGNPSSPHKMGTDARKVVEDCRATVAKKLSCTPAEVYFTSGATESNNTAVLGICKAQSRFAKRIVTDDSQHPSVSAPIRLLEEEGWEVVRVSTRGGKHDPEELAQALSKPTALCAFMTVNNETGALYDIKALRREIDKSGCGAYLHLDGVQGFMKCDTAATYRLADTVSLSAHKIGGFKGVGALMVRKSTRIKPLLAGGQQERGFRSGTENLYGIRSLALAVEGYGGEKLKDTYEFAIETLKQVPYLSFNVAESHCFHIISCIAKGIRSETLINHLSARGIYLSASSACSAKGKGNSVLKAFGVDEKDIVHALRISISPKTADSDIVALKDALLQAGERFLK